MSKFPHHEASTFSPGLFEKGFLFSDLFRKRKELLSLTWVK